MSYSRRPAGSLRHRIDILQRVPTLGMAGTATSLQPFLANVPAAIEPASASDTIRSGQDVSEVNIPVTIDFYPGIRSNMVVRFNRAGSVEQYYIKGIINPEERNVSLILMCLALGENE